MLMLDNAWTALYKNGGDNSKERVETIEGISGRLLCCYISG